MTHPIRRVCHDGVRHARAYVAMTGDAIKGFELRMCRPRWSSGPALLPHMFGMAFLTAQCRVAKCLFQNESEALKGIAGFGPGSQQPRLRRVVRRWNRRERAPQSANANGDFRE